MKSFLCVLCALVISGSVVMSQALSDDPSDQPASSKEKFKSMAKYIDKQARGFKAIMEKDIDTAGENFEEAGEIAAEDENWEGTLEAGYSLSTIGKTESAKNLFDTAKNLTTKARDWRSMLAVGYAYASLPEDQEAGGDAVEAIQQAEEAASAEKNWRALIEVGRGFTQVKAVDLAKSTLEKAQGFLREAEVKAEEEANWRSLIDIAGGYIQTRSVGLAQSSYEKALGILDDLKEITPPEDNWRALVEIGQGLTELKSAELAKATYAKALDLLEQVRDSEGLEMLARGYEDLGEEEKAGEVAELAQTVRKEEAAMGGGRKIRKKKERKTPSEGWSPTGKTLADPPEISDTSRGILAGKARIKNIEAHERSLAEAEAEREYSYEFKRYYFGGNDFSYRRWDAKGDFDVNGWAESQFGRYKLVNGVYILAD